MPTVLLAAMLAAAPADLDWWREARFGLFVHWGPVSIAGTEIGWSRGGPRRGTGGSGAIPASVYDTLYQHFNPTGFDAREWVRLAQDAGMKYLVFTTKHHDGFSMFDSALTEFDIMSSPFRRDIVGELAAACHEAGLRLGFYYSPPDWHHPDYRTERHARYVEYLHGQLAELCTKYGQVDVIWFDGLGGTATDWGTAELLPKLRALQPRVLFNDRAGVPADFTTPEQRVGAFQRDRPWESCITIGDQWAYRPNERVKSLEECLRTLLRCAGGDGNLLFNVGPRPDGRIEPAQAARLREMGAWLETNGDAVYGTRGGPYRPGPWGVSTCRGRTVYLAVFSFGGETLELPALSARVLSARVLGGGRPRVRQTDAALTATVAERDRDPIATVVALELDREAFELAPTATWPLGSVSVGAGGAASNVHGGNTAEYGPGRAFDGDPDTRWATDGGTSEAWLELRLPAAKTVDRVYLHEAYAGRVKAWELRVAEGDGWRTIHRGTTIGENQMVRFPATTGTVFRLVIAEATEGPTIWEVQLFESSAK